MAQVLLQWVLESARDSIVVWVGMECTHPDNQSNKQDRESLGDGGTWAMAPVAERGLHSLELRKNTTQQSDPNVERSEQKLSSSEARCAHLLRASQNEWCHVFSICGVQTMCDMCGQHAHQLCAIQFLIDVRTKCQNCNLGDLSNVPIHACTCAHSCVAWHKGSTRSPFHNLVFASIILDLQKFTF